MLQTMVVGVVTDIYIGQGENAFTRVTLRDSYYAGQDKGRQSRYTNCLAFGKTAEALARVQEGAQLEVTGTPQPSRPYLRRDAPQGISAADAIKNGSIATGFEVKIDNWAYVAKNRDDQPEETTDVQDDNYQEPAPQRSAPRQAAPTSRPAPAQGRPGYSNGNGQRQGGTATQQRPAPRPAPQEEVYADDPFDNQG